MDWSLALISQGIESTIERNEETGWGLTVVEEDLTPAIEILKRYQAENQHWPWRQQIRHTVLFDWGSLAWIALLGVFYWLETEIAGFRSAGLMDSAAVSHGQWWRLFTAVCLHADWAHLAMNTSIGLLLLGLSMGRYGTGIGLLAAYLAGAGGNVATWLMFPEHHSLGASGMVMGCVGLLAAQAFSVRSHHQARKYAASGVVSGILLFILLGLNPGSDVLAHFAGFIAGLLIGSLLFPFHRTSRSTVLNVFCGALFSALVVLTWWLALAERGEF